MIENIDISDLGKRIKEFDDEHCIKQIILVGVDGRIRNIELDIQEEEE